MMTESEFIRMSEELFEHIEDQIDEKRAGISTASLPETS